jgi:hypothetical protein
MSYKIVGKKGLSLQMPLQQCWKNQCPYYTGMSQLAANWWHPNALLILTWSRVADAKTKNSVQRLINIWQERNLFLPGFLARLRAITGQPYVPSTPSSNPTGSAAAAAAVVATAAHPSHVHHPSVHVPAPSIMPVYSHAPGQIAMPTHFVPAPVVPAPPPQTPIPSALKVID